MTDDAYVDRSTHPELTFSQRAVLNLLTVVEEFFAESGAPLTTEQKRAVEEVRRANGGTK